MQRIGIFGGSFDPIHRGHLAIASCARDQLKLDLVLFVPAARSPFKQEKRPAVSDADRLAMMRLAVDDVPEFRVSSWELEQGGVSYTVETLRHFEKEYPGSEFFLLMGADTYEGFERWKNPDQIRKMARVAIAPRASTGSPLVSTKNENSTDGCVYLKMPLSDASATQLRADLIRTRAATLANLPEATQQYIREHGLYQ